MLSYVNPAFVMRGLDPRIHLKTRIHPRRWIAGSSPAMTTGLASRTKNPSLSIKLVRQPRCQRRNHPQHRERRELDQHERNDPQIDVLGGDLGRRDAAQ